MKNFAPLCGKFSDGSSKLLALFVAFAAFQLHTDPFAPALLGKHPLAAAQRRVMADVLAVSAFEHRAPVRLVVELEIGYPLLHFFATYPVLVRRGEAGFHHR